MTPKHLFYQKRGQLLLSNLNKRHFEAYYCADKAEALEKALALIPTGAVVGWGGALSAQQIGLMDAIRTEEYCVLDRDTCNSPEEREEMQLRCLSSDVFIMGANALSLDGQMVNIDGNGNRVAALAYGPKAVLVIAGMNKVADDLEGAYRRARQIAAPTNEQRFQLPLPCNSTGSCFDCTSTSCICNQIVITRNCHPAGRIKLIIVGEDLGF